MVKLAPKKGARRGKKRLQSQEEQELTALLLEKDRLDGTGEQAIKAVEDAAI